MLMLLLLLLLFLLWLAFHKSMNKNPCQCRISQTNDSDILKFFNPNARDSLRLQQRALNSKSRS